MNERADGYVAHISFADAGVVGDGLFRAFMEGDT